MSMATATVEEKEKEGLERWLLRVASSQGRWRVSMAWWLVFGLCFRPWSSLIGRYVRARIAHPFAFHFYRSSFDNHPCGSCKTRFSKGSKVGFPIPGSNQLLLGPPHKVRSHSSHHARLLGKEYEGLGLNDGR